MGVGTTCTCTGRAWGRPPACSGLEPLPPQESQGPVMAHAALGVSNTHPMFPAEIHPCPVSQSARPRASSPQQPLAQAACLLLQWHVLRPRTCGCQSSEKLRLTAPFSALPWKWEPVFLTLLLPFFESLAMKRGQPGRQQWQ